MAGKGGGGDVVVTNSGNKLGKPLNLLMAVDEIQHVAAMEESMSETLSKQYLSVKQRLDFFAVGFRNAFISGFFMALLTPLAIGVIEKVIKIFGDAQPTFFDEVYAIILSLSFSLGYGLFLTSLRNSYVGTVSKGMIQNLFGGLAFGALLKFFIIFLLFNWIYIESTPQHVIAALQFIHRYMQTVNLVPVYYFIMKFRDVLLISAVVVGVASFLLIMIPIAALFISHYFKKIRRSKFDE